MDDRDLDSVATALRSLADAVEKLTRTIKRHPELLDSDVHGAVSDLQRARSAIAGIS